MMKRQKNRRAGEDVLYRVDPKKLSIKICFISTAAEYVAEYATTFENFSIEQIVVQPEVPEDIVQLPACVDGVFYFGTEEEAQDFIRKQIGM